MENLQDASSSGEENNPSPPSPSKDNTPPPSTSGQNQPPSPAPSSSGGEDDLPPLQQDNIKNIGDLSEGETATFKQSLERIGKSQVRAVRKAVKRNESLKDVIERRLSRRKTGELSSESSGDGGPDDQRPEGGVSDDQWSEDEAPEAEGAGTQPPGPGPIRGIASMSEEETAAFRAKLDQDLGADYLSKTYYKPGPLRRGQQREQIPREQRPADQSASSPQQTDHGSSSPQSPQSPSLSAREAVPTQPKQLFQSDDQPPIDQPPTSPTPTDDGSPINSVQDHPTIATDQSPSSPPGADQGASSLQSTDESSSTSESPLFTPHIPRQRQQATGQQSTGEQSIGQQPGSPMPPDDGSPVALIQDYPTLGAIIPTVLAVIFILILYRAIKYVVFQY